MTEILRKLRKAFGAAADARGDGSASAGAAPTHEEFATRTAFAVMQQRHAIEVDSNQEHIPVKRDQRIEWRVHVPGRLSYEKIFRQWAAGRE